MIEEEIKELKQEAEESRLKTKKLIAEAKVLFNL